MYKIPFYFLVMLVFSCQNQNCRSTSQLSVSPIQLELQRKEQELFNAKSPDEVVGFLRKNPSIAQNIFYLDQYPDPMVLADRIYGLINEPSIDTLYEESLAAFEANEDRMMEDLSQAFAIFNHYYPDAPVPVVQTLVTGLYHDLYISDEKVIIGLDYFIGDEATYRPTDIPEYILTRYNHDYLSPVLMKFFTSPWVENGKESTMLSEMIDFGKTYYLLSMLFPCTPEHQLIGYQEEVLTDVKANQTVIWARFIENEWLYETSDYTKRKFLGDRPNVYEIGEKCPGRIGAWVGWQIVNSYAEKSGKSLQEILSNTNHHEIFQVSGYKPIDIRE